MGVWTCHTRRYGQGRAVTVPGTGATLGRPASRARGLRYSVLDTYCVSTVFAHSLLAPVTAGVTEARPTNEQRGLMLQEKRNTLYSACITTRALA